MAGFGGTGNEGATAPPDRPRDFDWRLCTLFVL